ncbi:MAG: ribonuclease HII [Candidatus Dormibacteria bacterium]
MPRFRLTTYLRDTFGVEDLGSFRLCGMDEVGRGSYAGPLVAAAVVLPPRFRHPLLRDSKLLTARQRELVGAIIRRRALAWVVAEISAADINRSGLGWANLEIFRRLVDLVEADGYCCDGRLRINASRAVHCLVKGDNLVPAISAASIVAKVHRDAIMTAMHHDAPHYNWASNKGYGAREHRDAIRSHGPHPQHRTVFISNMMQLDLAFDPPSRVALHGAPA